jgi:hypothetical protein
VQGLSLLRYAFNVGYNYPVLAATRKDTLLKGAGALAGFYITGWFAASWLSRCRFAPLAPLLRLYSSSSSSSSSSLTRNRYVSGWHLLFIWWGA